jgi:DNA-binding transcriptional ArsR family regulator
MPPRGQASAARVFDALGDATRRAIVERLVQGPQSVSRLAEPLGVTVTAIGQHLQVLSEAGLVRSDKVGRVRTCRIAPQGFAVIETWVKQQRSIWERKLDRLGELLDEED